MTEALAEQLALLPGYLSRHILLTVTALAVGIGLSLPLAVLAVRRRAVAAVVLGAAGAVQTVPSLALLALMVPLFGRIGFAPAVTALTLYSMLPVLRNTVTGLQEVDRTLIEAARGVGMTEGQILRQVQFPLALPMIVAGIRTAAIWVVGIATLSTPVGAASLGNYIFSGLQTRNYTAVLVGCASATALALIIDAMIRGVESGLRQRQPLRIWTWTFAALGLLLVGLSPLAWSALGRDSRPRILVGAKTFTEQFILAETLAQRLSDAGFNAEALSSLGSTVAFDALAAGRIDCYIDYSGTIWTTQMHRDDQPGPEAVLEEMTHWLRENHNIECLGALGFENTYALAVRSETAEELGLERISDLARHAADLRIAGDYEFFGRPEWSALQETYRLRFREEVGMDAALMYTALDQGEVDVIAAFSTDGRIAAFDLVVLEDSRAALPPYEAVLLVRPGILDSAEAAAVLQGMIGAVSDEAMREANRLVDVDGRPVREAAERLAERLP